MANLLPIFSTSKTSPGSQVVSEVITKRTSLWPYGVTSLSCLVASSRQFCTEASPAQSKPNFWVPRSFRCSTWRCGDPDSSVMTLATPFLVQQIES